MSVTWGGGKAKQGRRLGGGTRAAAPAPHAPSPEPTVASVAADAEKLRSSRFEPVRVAVGPDGDPIPASPWA